MVEFERPIKAEDADTLAFAGLSAATFDAREAVYTDYLSRMEIKPSWLGRADAQARRIIANKKRYQNVSSIIQKRHGNYIPWQFIGVIHMMEGDCNFGTHLHNGDSLQARTRQVPAGRPRTGKPPFTWEESAVDALVMKNFDEEDKWTMEKICYNLERYNGWGYANKGVPSPYLWSGSNIYSKGKYVRDGVYDPDHVSQQVGAIVLLKRILTLDVEVKEVVESSVKLSWLNSIRAWFVATFGSYFGLDSLGYIPENVKKFEALGISKQGWAVIGLITLVWGIISFVQYRTIKDYKEGRYTPSKMEEKEVSLLDTSL